MRSLKGDGKMKKKGFTPLEIRRPKRLPTRPPEAERGGSLTGFTLVELLTVMAIILILAGLISAGVFAG